MFSRELNKGSAWRPVGAQLLIALLLGQTLPAIAQVPLPPGTGARSVFPPSNTPLVKTTPIVTLRQAAKSGDLSFTLSGDGSRTKNLRLEWTNNTNRNMRILIPAFETFRPSVPRYQWIMSSRDRLISIPGSTKAGEMTFTDLPTMCISPRSVPPPPNMTGIPPIKKLLDPKFFDLFKGANGQISQDKCTEAVKTGKVGDVECSSQHKGYAQSILKSWQQIDTDGVPGCSEKELSEWSVSYELTDYPDPSLWKKFSRIVAAGEDLHKKHKYPDGTGLRDVKGDATQFAIWTALGKKTGKPEDQVTETSFVEDGMKEVGRMMKQSQEAAKKFGEDFLLGPNGIAVAKDPKVKKALDAKAAAIFACVDLTLRHSDDPNLEQPKLPVDSRWQNCTQVGERAFDNGDYTEAEELIASALQEAETFGESDPRLATNLYDLARVYLDQGRYKDTEPPLARALKIQKKLAPESPEIASTENIYGVLERNIGRSEAAKSSKTEAEKAYAASESHFDGAKEIRTKVVGANSKEVGEVLNNLGHLYILENRVSDAKTNLDQALAIRIKEVGNDSPEVAEVNRNIAELYEKQGDYAKAEKFYQLSLLAAKNSLGVEHPYVATIIDGMGQVAKLQNKDAGLYEGKAKEIRSKTLGSNAENLTYLPDDYQALTRIMSFAKANDKIESSVSDILASSDNTINVDKAEYNRPIKDKWAVVIGISNFKDSSINLKYSANDAKAFRKYLIEDAHFAPDHVRLLLNEKAIRENIMSQIGENWLPRVAQPDDLVVIYFSGHGSPSAADQRGNNFLVAYNTDKDHLFSTGIDLTDFASLVKKRVASKRIVMVMDACHSGAAAEGTKGLVRIKNVNADEIVQGTGQLVICSSEPAQVSWESTRYPNGVFTHYLIEGLKLKGPTTPLGDAVDFMKAKVQEEVAYDRKGEQQVPVVKSVWDGKALIIGAPPTEVRATPPGDPSEISDATDNTPTIGAKKITPSNATKGTPAHPPTPAIKRPATAPRKAG